MVEPAFVNASEASARLGVSVRTTVRCLEAWILRGFRVGKARNAELMISVRSLEAFIDDPPTMIPSPPTRRIRITTA